jgi:putative chitinase
MTDFDTALRKLWPSGDEKIPGLRAGMIASAPAVFAKYGITSPLLLAHVMAQGSHESGAGHEVVENLSYSAARMTQVWPSRFPTFASAEPYAHNPRALADKVYNGRMGNRPGTDDGYNFRGQGFSQTTGRDEYARLGKLTSLDLVNHPELLIDPRYFLECGVANFVLCGCLPFAKADDVVNVTRRLNGGTVGLDHRRQWLARWKAELGTAPIVPAPAGPRVIRRPRRCRGPPDQVRGRPRNQVRGRLFRNQQRLPRSHPSPTLPRAPSARSSRQFSLQSSKGKADIMGLLLIALAFAGGYAASIHSWPWVRTQAVGIAAETANLRRRAADLEAKIRGL